MLAVTQRCDTVVTGAMTRKFRNINGGVIDNDYRYLSTF
jgi:hypothetical protein